MKQDEIRQKLIDGTIYVIAGEGLEKASTKQIGQASAVNEAYIYRCFTNKETMFAKVFEILDEELVAKGMQHISIMYQRDMDYELRCRFFFAAIWSFLLGSREKCLTYVRYYYSPYFTKYSAAGHKQRYKALIERFSEAFKTEADVWMILNHILNVMLDFAVKVHNDEMSGEDNYSEHVFRVVYASIKQYFKNYEECDSRI